MGFLSNQILYSKINEINENVEELKSLSPFSYKGSVANKAALPTAASKGDVYTTTDDGNEYVYDGSSWILLGADISTLKTQVETNTKDIETNTENIEANTEEIDKLKTLIVKKFGFRRDKNDSNPATRIAYLADAEGVAPFTYDFTNQVVDMGGWEEFIKAVCRPVMLNYDGSVAYELDRDDTTKKVDGTDSDIANADFAGNAMVEFGKYRYVSRLTIGDYDYVYFSNTKINDTYNDYAFINEDGDLKEHFYFSMFEGSYDNTRLRSIAGAEIMRNTSATTETTRAKANGDDYNTGAWSQLNYIWDLLTLIGKSDNLQAVFGKGISTYTWNDGINPFGWTVGQSKDKGAFYGESAGQGVVRTLYIEDLWGRAWDRYNGLVNVNGTMKVKMTPPYPTPTDSADTYADYTEVGTTPAGGYVKTALCGDYGFIPTTTGGSDTTYFCDYFYKNDSGVKFALVGGTWNYGGSCGRCVALGAAASDGSVHIGSRLSLI